jgi:glycerol-3-phosphate O-acyltransferase
MREGTAPKIFQFMGEREKILREVAGRVVAQKIEEARASRAHSLEYVLNEAAYLEMERLERGASRLDLRPYSYWQSLARTVGRADEAEKIRILRELVELYSRDIVGKFTPTVYRFATKVLPVGLSLLFNAQSLETLRHGFKGLAERIILEGEIDTVRRLADRGTIIVVPTHSSNLDSIVVGWALWEADLPPVTYGAGKNLFTNPFISFFMHNLGAYKVDRRIRHTLYKDLLKTYSEVLLERGYHSLFFPGGTRSRSNRVERKLKLGLLGSALSAYTRNLLASRPRPRIFICPLTINYHLVLEAETLIFDHLRQDGGARYIIEDDEFSDLGRILRFLFKTMSMEETLYLRFAPPLDPFGNPVDAEGESLDPHGRRIDPARYLWVDGQVKADRDRDAEYTRECGRAVIKSFVANNVVVSTSFLAFALYQHLEERHPGLDLYRLLRVAKGERIPWDEVRCGAERLLGVVRSLAAAGKLRLSRDLAGLPSSELCEKAAAVLGMYHTTPVIVRLADGIEVRNPDLLYYYSNRLRGYGIEALLPQREGARAGGA